MVDFVYLLIYILTREHYLVVTQIWTLKYGHIFLNNWIGKSSEVSKHSTSVFPISRRGAGRAGQRPEPGRPLLHAPPVAPPPGGVEPPSW